MTSQVKPGQEMDRSTNVQWGQAASAFRDLGIVSRLGWAEKRRSSLRPELAAIARTLQATPVESDLLYLCDSKAALNKMSPWIGSGPRTTLAGDANADIMMTIIECVRERVLRGARTFMVCTPFTTPGSQ